MSYFCYKQYCIDSFIEQIVFYCKNVEYRSLKLTWVCFDFFVNPNTGKLQVKFFSTVFSDAKNLYRVEGGLENVLESGFFVVRSALFRTHSIMQDVVGQTCPYLLHHWGTWKIFKKLQTLGLEHLSIIRGKLKGIQNFYWGARGCQDHFWWGLSLPLPVMCA